MKSLSKSNKKQRRHARVRAQVSGTSERPRLHVSRSLTGLYLQLIDDKAGKTLASVNSKKDLGKKIEAGDRKGKIAIAYVLGKTLAEKAAAANIVKAVFDRSGHKYHGRVKAAAEGARDGGLQF